MKPLYAHDWHHCVRCGCVYPTSALRHLHRQDPLLNIDEHVYVCKDEKRCALYKAHRAKQLENEARALKRDITKAPIRSRRA